MNFRGNKLAFREPFWWMLQRIKRAPGFNVFDDDRVDLNFFVSLETGDSPFTAGELLQLLKSMETLHVLKIQEKFYPGPLDHLRLFNQVDPCHYHAKLIQPAFDELFDMYQSEAVTRQARGELDLLNEFSFRLGDLKITYKNHCFYLNDINLPFRKLQRGKLPWKLWQAVVARQNPFFTPEELIEKNGVLKGSSVEDLRVSLRQTFKPDFRKNLEALCKKSGLHFPKDLFEEKMFVWEGALYLVKL